MKQTFACLCDLPKKLATKDKIEPLGFQRVGPKNEQPKVTWPIVPFRTNVNFNMCYCI